MERQGNTWQQKFAQNDATNRQQALMPSQRGRGIVISAPGQPAFCPKQEEKELTRGVCLWCVFQLGLCGSQAYCLVVVLLLGVLYRKLFVLADAVAALSSFLLLAITLVLETCSHLLEYR